MTRNDAIKLILEELDKAEVKFPKWPQDIIHGVAIMAEETGESVQAALDFVYSDGDVEKIKKEVAQSGAMAIRNLMHL